MEPSEKMDYIDRLFSRVELLGKKINKYIKYIILLSTLLLSISLGGIELDRRIDTEWLEIKISPTLLVVILSFTLVSLQYYLINLINLNNSIDKELTEQYLSFSKKIPATNVSIYNLTEYPIPFRILNDNTILNKTKIGKLASKSLELMIYAVLILLPFISVASVFVYLIKENGFTIWMVTVFSFFLLFLAVLIIGMLSNTNKTNQY